MEEKNNYTYQDNVPPNGDNNIDEAYDSGFESGYKTALNINKKLNKEEKKSGIVIRSIVVGVLAFNLFVIFLLFYEIFFNDFYDDKAYRLERCEDYYQNMEYVNLMEDIEYCNDGDEKFDKYEEIIKAYKIYITGMQWNITSKEEFPEAEENVEASINELKSMESDLNYSQNKKYIDNFIKKLQKFDSDLGE